MGDPYYRHYRIYLHDVIGGDRSEAIRIGPAQARHHAIRSNWDAWPFIGEEDSHGELLSTPLSSQVSLARAQLRSGARIRVALKGELNVHELEFHVHPTHLVELSITGSWNEALLFS